MALTETPNILDSMRGLLDDHLGKKEFTDAFKLVTKTLTDFKKSNEQEWTLIHSALQMLEAKLYDTNAKSLGDIHQSVDTRSAQTITDLKRTVETRLNQAVSQARAEVERALSEQQDGMNFLRDKLTAIQDGQNGKDADEAAVAEKVLAELLPRLDEEVSKLKTQIQAAPTGTTRAGWGAHPLAIAQSGTVKAKVARHLNFTGATVTQNRDGTTTVAVSASGLSVLAATGAINDSNKVFTFASTPTFVVVNGAIYKNGGGVTIATTTATLDNVVGTGGSIFGLG